MVKTTIYFDVRGHYSKIGNEYEWVGTEELGTLVVRKSEDEITYSDVIDGIWKKLGEDRGIETVRLSYLLKISGRTNVMYIRDDDDVYRYLSNARRANGCVLNVEVLEKEVQEFVYRAALANCFDFAIINSDKKLLVLKCMREKSGIYELRR